MSSQDHYTLPARKRSEYKAAVKQWQALERAPGVSLATRKWMMQSLDCFHDTPLEAVGFPSGVNDRSVVHEVTRSMVISKPANLSSGNWDCHITLNPVAGQTGSDTAVGFDPVFNQVARLNGNACGAVYDMTGEIAASRPTLVAPFVGAPVLIHRVPTGTQTYNNEPTLAALNLGAVDIPPQYLKGPHRVVGLAFEVVNTTEMLNKNGSVTVYRVPARITDGVLNVVSQMPIGTPGVLADGSPAGVTTLASANASPVRAYGSIRPPIDASQASLTHGSQTWEAAEGAYVTGVFEEPPELLNQRSAFHYWYNADTDPTSAVVNYGLGPGVQAQVGGGVPTQVLNAHNDSTFAGLGSVAGTVTTTTNGTSRFPGTSLVPVSRSGAYFQGLSNQTTLKLTVRFFIERIPPLSEPDIYTLAMPSPPYAPEAWELYSRVMEELPPGVMFTENPLGEWFKKVANVVAKYAPAVGTTLGNMGVPGAGMIGNALGQAGHGVQLLMGGRQPQPKKKPPPVPPRPAKKVAPQKKAGK